MLILFVCGLFDGFVLGWVAELAGEFGEWLAGYTDSGAGPEGPNPEYRWSRAVLQMGFCGSVV